MKGHTAKAVISIAKKYWYHRFRELGVKTHDIIVGGKKGKTGKKVLADVGKGLIFGKKVTIPAQPAKPFLRPAIDGKGEAAIQAMKEALGKRLDEEWRK